VNRIIISIVIALIIPLSALADMDYIGLFADPAGEQCFTDLVPGASSTIYILAKVPNLGVGGITVAEFRVDNLPPNDDPPVGYWTVEWNSTLVIGDIEEGVAIAFSTPQIGDIVELGRITLEPQSDSWVAENHMVSVEESHSSGQLVLVDHEFVTHEVPGGDLTLNCTNPDMCTCEMSDCDISPPALSFGEVIQGESAQMQFRILNQGNLVLEGVVSSPSEHYQVVEGGEPYLLEPGEYLDVTIRFAPLAAGELPCYVDTGTSDCADLYCIGTGISICLFNIPDFVDLGEMDVGEYVDLDFNILNPMDSGRTFSGDVDLQHDSFAIIRGGGPFTLPAGQSRAVRIRCAPVRTGVLECVVDLGTPFCDQITYRVIGETPVDSHVNTDHIGLFRIWNGHGCDGHLPLNEWSEFQLIAVIPELQTEGIISAAFALNNLPVNRPGESGVFQIIWNESANVTTNQNNYLVHFDQPQTGWFVDLGTVRFKPYTEGWAEVDQVVSVINHRDNDMVQITTPSGVDHGIEGAAFTLNCTDPDDCSCGLFDEPVCSITPVDLDFDFTYPGESTVRQFTIANLGGGMLSGVLQAPCQWFSLSDAGAEFNLAGGESLEVTVTFTPLEVGWYDCELDLVPSHCGEIYLHGQCDLPPVCEVDPTELDFGEVQVGDSGDQDLSITNTGGSNLMGDVQLDDQQFAVISGGGQFDLAAGETRAVTVRFTPLDYGHASAELSLGSSFCIPFVTCLGLSRPAGSEGDIIGLFTDSAGEICIDDAVIGETDTLFIIAKLPTLAEYGYRGFRFRVANLPVNGDGGIWTTDWFADTVSGDVETDLILEFDAPLTDQQVILGRILYTPENQDWLGIDHRLQVLGAGDDSPPLIAAPDGTWWSLVRGQFTFNCSNPDYCACEVPTPICLLDPTEIHFGQGWTGRYYTRQFTITNDGTGFLQGDLDLIGAYFHLTEGEGPFELGEGEQLQGEVTFYSTVEGNFEATIITGIEECPEIPVTGSAIDYSGGGIDGFIGIAADENYTYCYADAVENVTIYLFAYTGETGGIRGAEFRVENWPVSPDFGHAIFNWNTDLVIGDIDWGITLVFPTPIDGPFIYLGSVTLIVTSPDYFGMDYLMEVVETNDSGRLILIDENFGEYPVWGGMFTFNCSDAVLCPCLDYASPVTISQFDLAAEPGQVQVDWTCEITAETTFRLEAQLGEEMWEPTFRQLPSGTYRAIDRRAGLADGGIVQYRLFSRELGDQWLLQRSETVLVPEARFENLLMPGHPNPFNPTVTLPFSLATTQQARLAIYDITGRRISVVVEGVMARGEHEVVWHGRNSAGAEVASGVYFARLELAGAVKSQKLILLR
jgi:hypothetical protein